MLEDFVEKIGGQQQMSWHLQDFRFLSVDSSISQRVRFELIFRSLEKWLLQYFMHTL
jgi:hypothetical protein